MESMNLFSDMESYAESFDGYQESPIQAIQAMESYFNESAHQFDIDEAFGLDESKRAELIDALSGLEKAVSFAINCWKKGAE